MVQRVETVAGTIIAISAQIPATFNQAGYEAIGLYFATIGEITDGGEHGREYAEVTHSPIATRGVQKFKGGFNEGTQTLQLAIDDDDAGQVILKAASLSDNDYSFKETFQGGTVHYFQAKVMGFKQAASGVDSIRSASVTLSITTSSAGVGIVEVLGA